MNHLDAVNEYLQTRLARRAELAGFELRKNRCVFSRESSFRFSSRKM